MPDIDLSVEVEGLDEVIDKFKNMPQKIEGKMNEAMYKSLDTLHENVPPYIPQVVPPEVYTRRGSGGLGGSLGTGYGGGKQGTPTVYSVTGIGKDKVGQFGTNLSYAPYVIGPRDAPKGERQAYMHQPGYKGRPGWWTMDTIKEKALPKIKQIWNKFIKEALNL